MKLAATLIGIVSAADLYGATLNVGDGDVFTRSTLSHATEFFDEGRVVPYFGPDGQWHETHGWVSLYGALAGGQYFFTDLFSLSNTNTVNVSWDFTGSDYTLKWIIAFNENTEQLFRVNGNAKLVGSDNITLPNGVDGIAFYGTGPGTRAGDSGSSWLLLTIALIPLLRKCQPTS